MDFEKCDHCCLARKEKARKGWKKQNMYEMLDRVSQ